MGQGVIVVTSILRQLQQVLYCILKENDLQSQYIKIHFIMPQKEQQILFTMLTRGRVTKIRAIVNLMGDKLIAARFVDGLGLVLIIEDILTKESFLILEKNIIKGDFWRAKKINLVDLRSTDEELIECLEESEEDASDVESVDLEEEERCMLARKRIDSLSDCLSE